MIQTADQQMAHHKVKTQADFKRLQAKQVRALAAAGQPVAIWFDRTTHLARVDFGRWITDCQCGSGVAVHPDWSEAYCLGCGAMLTAVVFPSNRAAIERVLSKRRFQRFQFYVPSRDTVDTLIAENLAHGMEAQ